MPCYAAFAQSLADEIAPALPLVKFLVSKGLDSAVSHLGWEERMHSGAQVLDLTYFAEITPSRARILVLNSKGEAPVPFAFNTFRADKLPRFSRVQLSLYGETIFLGLLTAVHREASGALVLTYDDDRILLAGTPLRGGYAMDVMNGGENIFWYSSFAPIFNPKGASNLYRATESAPPVFRRLANRSLPGWTPALICEYLRYYLTTITPMQGLGLQTAYLDWPEGSLTFPDAAGEGMNAEAPEIEARGQSVLKILCHALEIGGTREVTLSYRGDGISQIEFFSRQAPADEKAARTIYIQTAGEVAGNVLGAEDVEGTEEAEKLATEVLVDGAVKTTEMQLEYDRGAPAAATIVPVAEQDADFLVVLAATTKGTDTRRAAIRAARQKYPLAFAAFRLVKDSNEAAAGAVVLEAALGGIASVLHPITRAPMNEQLTKTNTDGIPYPLRAQIKSDLGSGAEWHDVTSNLGLFLDDEGNICLFGLSDDKAEQVFDLLYEGPTGQPIKLENYDPGDEDTFPYYRPIRLNVALPQNARTTATAGIRAGDDPNEISDRVDPGVRLQHYVLAPRSFRHETRVASQPYSGSGSMTDTPTDETGKATQHAKKRLKDIGRLGQQLPVTLIGCRTDLRAGTFVGKVVLKDGAGADAGEIAVNAPLGQVVVDFSAAQKTIVRAM